MGTAKTVGNIGGVVAGGGLLVAGAPVLSTAAEGAFGWLGLSSIGNAIGGALMSAYSAASGIGFLGIGSAVKAIGSTAVGAIVGTSKLTTSVLSLTIPAAGPLTTGLITAMKAVSISAATAAAIAPGLAIGLVAAAIIGGAVLAHRFIYSVGKDIDSSIEQRQIATQQSAQHHQQARQHQQHRAFAPAQALDSVQKVVETPAITPTEPPTFSHVDAQKERRLKADISKHIPLI